LKFYVKAAQYAYNLAFDIPTPPPSPKVQLTQAPNEIVLDWGQDTAAITATESYAKGGFTFEGYNVYQLPTSSSLKASATRIATYDIEDGLMTLMDKDLVQGVVTSVPVQFGNDQGVRHHIVLNKDYINSRVLVNGQSYYYAVTAYSYNPDATLATQVLENPFTVITAIPQSDVPGYSSTSKIGDVLPTVATLKGATIKTDAKAIVTVIDPKKTNGHTYEVSFDTLAGYYDPDNGWTTGDTYWKLTDKNTGKLLFSSGKKAQLFPLDAVPDVIEDQYPSVDGLYVQVTNCGSGIKNYSWSPTKLFTTANGDTYFLVGQDFEGSTVDLNHLKNVEVRFSSDKTKWQKAYRYVRLGQNAPAQASYAPYITNPKSYGYQDYNLSFPGQVWDVESTPNRQLNIAFIEDNEAYPTGNVQGLWRPPAGSNSAGGREYTFIMASTYSDQAQAPYINVTGNSGALDEMYSMWPIAYASVFPSDPWSNVTTTLKINHYNPLDLATKISFTSPAAITYNNQTAQSDVDKVNVFPNPYYARQMFEKDRYNKYVTFNHLPANATIRIFTLSGTMVRTIRKNDNTQFTTWDLKNENYLPVASGMYIAYIDMPDVGKTKILKIAIIMEAQILDRM
jgi:hypothetical protein